MIYLAYAVAWICTAAATGLGLYYTHSPWCLRFYSGRNIT